MSRTSRTAAGTAAGTAAATALLLPLALAAPASAQAGALEVRVLHGIPGVPVDVYVDGERAIDDFQPGDTTDDLSGVLAPGSYEVTVFPADAPDGTGEPVIGPATLQVPESGNVSAVAHLTEAGEPTLTPFVNDTAPTAAGQGRVVVRHTAAAPTVDVLVDGTPALTGITNPGEASAALPAGTVSAAVAATGTTEPVIGPADLTVTPGTATVVYAVGSLADGTLDLLVREVSVGEQAAPAGPAAPAPAPGTGTGSGSGSTPAGVPAGTGGLVDDGTGLPASVLLASGLGLAVAAGGGLRLARTRGER